MARTIRSELQSLFTLIKYEKKKRSSWDNAMSIRVLCVDDIWFDAINNAVVAASVALKWTGKSLCLAKGEKIGRRTEKNLESFCFIQNFSVDEWYFVSCFVQLWTILANSHSNAIPSTSYINCIQYSFPNTLIFRIFSLSHTISMDPTFVWTEFRIDCSVVWLWLIVNGENS